MTRALPTDLDQVSHDLSIPVLFLWAPPFLTNSHIRSISASVLPRNGGFLLAISYVAAGWEGSKGHAPGFPKDGSWTIKHEGLMQSL